MEIAAREVSLHSREVATLLPGRYIELKIQDAGVGIPEGDLHKIFDPYFSTKERGSQKGRGLGLAICHSIVGKHKGAVSVQSSLGKGATFFVHLPVASEQGLPVVEASRAANPMDRPAKGKILVMDDDERVSWIISEMLRSMDYTVETSANGNHAVELYVNERRTGAPFDLVLLDLTVPGGMGAMDAIKKLREIDPAVRAIVSSGYAEHPIMQVFASCGFAAAIAKPYNIEHLRVALIKVLGLA